MPRKRECLVCKRLVPVMGRGLCRDCYTKLKKEGELDAKYPVGGMDQVAEEAAEETTPEAFIESDEIDEFLSGDGLLLHEDQGLTLGRNLLYIEFKDRDQDLLDALKSWAEDDRRSLSQQILTILDRANALNLKGEFTV